MARFLTAPTIRHLPFGAATRLLNHPGSVSACTSSYSRSDPNTKSNVSRSSISFHPFSPVVVVVGWFFRVDRVPRRAWTLALLDPVQPSHEGDGRRRRAHAHRGGVELAVSIDGEHEGVQQRALKVRERHRRRAQLRREQPAGADARADLQAPLPLAPSRVGGRAPRRA